MSSLLVEIVGSFVIFHNTPTSSVPSSWICHLKYDQIYIWSHGWDWRNVWYWCCCSMYHQHYFACKSPKVDSYPHISTRTCCLASMSVIRPLVLWIKKKDLWTNSNHHDQTLNAALPTTSFVAWVEWVHKPSGYCVQRSILGWYSWFQTWDTFQQHYICGEVKVILGLQIVFSSSYLTWLVGHLGHHQINQFNFFWCYHQLDHWTFLLWVGWYIESINEWRQSALAKL